MNQELLPGNGDLPFRSFHNIFRSLLLNLLGSVKLELQEELHVVETQEEIFSLSADQIDELVLYAIDHFRDTSGGMEYIYNQWNATFFKANPKFKPLLLLNKQELEDLEVQQGFCRHISVMQENVKPFLEKLFKNEKELEKARSAAFSNKAIDLQALERAFDAS